MTRRWNRLEKELTRSVSTKEALSRFDEMKRNHPELAGAAPLDLVAFFREKDVTIDKKDPVYAALVRIVQAGEDDADLAWTLLWLGLWPCLRVLYGQRHRRQADDDELVGHITAAFTSVVAAVQLNRVNRVTAALVWNTTRRLCDLEARHRTDAFRAEPLPTDDELEGLDTCFHVPPHSEPSLLETRVMADQDGALVWAIAVEGYNQAEVAARLGLSHAAVRQRYHRALERLREKVGHTSTPSNRSLLVRGYAAAAASSF